MNARKISQLTLLCAAGSLLALPAVVTAAATNSNAPVVLDAKDSRGSIVKADLEKNTFLIRMSDDKEMEFIVNKDTKYTLNGKESTKEEVLKIGAYVTVHHEGKTASSVDARSE